MQPVGRAIDWLARRIIRLLPHDTRLYVRLKSLRRRLPSGSPPSPVERLLEAFAEAYPDASFIQIGSNDGSNLDPLRPFIVSRRWRGILVEPVPHVFERLQRNYGLRPGLAFANVAIAEADGTREFYHLRPAKGEPGLPPWYDLLGSFSRDVILSHRNQIPDIETRLVTLTVPCLTFESLCRRHALDHLDLLHIDAEGYDDRILAQVDLDRWHPRFVMYEHHHLPAAARMIVHQRFRRHGYRMLEHGYDTVCLRLTRPETRDERLIRLWHELTGAAP